MSANDKKLQLRTPGLRLLAACALAVAVLGLWHGLDVRDGIARTGNRFLYGWYGAAFVWGMGLLAASGWLLLIRRQWSLERVFVVCSLALGAVSYTHLIKYGIGETEVLTIRICVTVADCLLIRVQDDGDGMSREKLEELRNLMKEENRTGKAHFGLYNINRRIKLMYGAQYGVDIDSRQGQGTSVSMRLPVRHKGEKKHDQGSDCGG